LTSAVPGLQAIGIVAAKEELTVAPARDQRVVAGTAVEELCSAVPALQAIGTGFAIEALIDAPPPTSVSSPPWPSR
jgi:hypothetical protein